MCACTNLVEKYFCGFRHQNSATHNAQREKKMVNMNLSYIHISYCATVKKIFEQFRMDCWVCENLLTRSPFFVRQEQRIWNGNTTSETLIETWECSQIKMTQIKPYEPCEIWIPRKNATKNASSHFNDVKRFELHILHFGFYCSLLSHTKFDIQIKNSQKF